MIAERAIDAVRPLKLIYIGAGVSGILAAIRFRQAVPSLDLVIYEKNADVGGTWFENRYPGCACDVPSHAYQLSFESWPDWSDFYANAPEILKYWKLVAKKYDVTKHIRFRHKCIEARWNEQACKWTVKIEDLDTGLTLEDSADVLMTGTGTLNDWKWPDIPNLHQFEGPLLHSANWDEGFDPTDKAVAVIGGGSSGIQIVPALAPRVKSIDHYVRGKTWIASQIAEDVVKARHNNGTTTSNFSYTPEEIEAWRNNPAAYLQYRKVLEFGLNNNYAVTQRGSARQQAARDEYTALMKDRLREKPELCDLLIPDYPPLCKRLTPGPGYLEAIASPKVNFITDPISDVERTGIITADGTHRPVDAIVCATGFNTSPSAGFPIYGRDGVNLRIKYRSRPKSYLGLCTDNFPNFFQSLGPNSFQGAGSLLIMLEHIHLYVAQILQRLATGNVKTIEPKRSQVEKFTAFCEEYFKRTVYSDKCESWYKSSDPEERRAGRVTALWPGSCMHALQALSSVRWEDFEMEPHDGNDFGWFGNGLTTRETSGSPDIEDLTWYLQTTNFLDTVDTDTTQQTPELQCPQTISAVDAVGPDIGMQERKAQESSDRNRVDNQVNGFGQQHSESVNSCGVDAVNVTNGLKVPEAFMAQTLGLSRPVDIHQWTTTT
ncbi:hypothetical protein HRR87_008535 [Exophiala dermatitidis]|nr:hypothetical protein HRR92_007779 [Exophiala dermatitidis]KAJ4690355.1 hypothetical protein HRR87_008535 [Exophiala dermatitidis]